MFWLLLKTKSCFLFFYETEYLRNKGFYYIRKLANGFKYNKLRECKQKMILFEFSGF